MKKPNLLLFFTDDQRFDTIAALGNPDIHTPHLDRLAARGTACTHAHIPVGTDPAVCMPSRAMLLTGRTLFDIEGEGQTIPPEHCTLGECLQEAGYHCFGTGKWHNGCDAYARCFTDGAEIFFGGMADHWNVPACDFDPTGAYRGKGARVIADPMRERRVSTRLADHIRPGVHSTDLIGGAVRNFLDTYRGEAPYFAYVSLMAPHDPRSMPPEFLELYDPASLSLPPNLLPEHPFENGALRIRDENLASFPRTEEEVRIHLAQYYAMISHLDHELGQVLDRIEARGETENTIVVFAGDNGLAVGQHGLMGKQNCYEHSIRVPLVVAGPGIAPGKQTGEAMYLFDLFPTLAEMLDVPAPESVTGRSMAGVLQGEERGREKLYFAYTDTQRAVKAEGCKYILYAVEGEPVREQLFDLADDPWEMKDLSPDPSFREIRDRLRHQLVELAEEWGDTRNEWGRKFWSRLERGGGFPAESTSQSGI
jgi:arylsulfatase A-like enzyme